MNNKLIIFFLSISFFSFGQTSKNLIVTFSVTSCSHGTANYYWIIPDSTINNITGQYKIYPLYLDSFSVNKLNTCKKGEKVDIFSYQKGENYIFKAKYLKELDKLKILLSKKKNKIFNQKIKKKWYKGGRCSETIILSITAIQGNFYYCPSGKILKKIFNYEGKIVLPNSSFKIDLEYLNSEKVKDFLFTADFSLINYTNTL